MASCSGRFLAAQLPLPQTSGFFSEMEVVLLSSVAGFAAAGAWFSWNRRRDQRRYSLIATPAERYRRMTFSVLGIFGFVTIAAIAARYPMALLIAIAQIVSLPIFAIPIVPFLIGVLWPLILLFRWMRNSRTRISPTGHPNFRFPTDPLPGVTRDVQCWAMNYFAHG